MVIFDGQANTEVLSDLSDESIVESQTEETPQEETPAEDSTEQSEAEEMDSPEEQPIDYAAEIERLNARNAQLLQSYNNLRADYNRKNTANNQRISELEGQLKAPPSEVPAKDPELENLLAPYLDPYKQQLSEMQEKIAQTEREATEKAANARVNSTVESLRARYPELKEDKAVGDVISEAVRLSMDNGDPELFKKYPDMVFGLAIENLYGEQRRNATVQAVNAAAAQARAATLSEQSAKESAKVGLEAQTTTNRTDAPTPSEEDNIRASISGVKRGGLFG